MTEPDVTLTDYAIALECLVFCVLALRWHARRDLRRWWVVFFASIGIAAAIGGTMHGFYPDDQSVAGRGLWLATMLTLGVTSLAAWAVGSHLLRLPAILGTAVAVFVIYAVVVVFAYREFLAAIIMYLPATVFLLVVLVSRHRREPHRALTLAITGMVLTFIAAGIQQAKIAVHPVYLDHNALYHVVQAVALLLIFIGAKHTSVVPETGHGHH
jgi:hypothetical protein